MKILSTKVRFWCSITTVREEILDFNDRSVIYT